MEDIEKRLDQIEEHIAILTNSVKDLTSISKTLMETISIMKDYLIQNNGMPSNIIHIDNSGIRQ